MFPKPKYKKKRALRNPIPTENDICNICGKPYAHTHEVFQGKNRQKSIKWGMQVKLCNEHHTGDNGIHFNKKLDFEYKKVYQYIFEALCGHEKFMQEFGRNYLDMTLEEFIKSGVA